MMQQVFCPQQVAGLCQTQTMQAPTVPLNIMVDPVLTMPGSTQQCGRCLVAPVSAACSGGVTLRINISVEPTTQTQPLLGEGLGVGPRRRI